MPFRQLIFFKKIIQMDEVLAAEALLITMMVLHGIMLVIHVAFMLLEDLDGHRLIFFLFCQLVVSRYWDPPNHF